MTTAPPLRTGPSDREVARGLGWSGVTYLAKSALQFLVGVALARLLPPSAFGAVAMVLLFSQLALLFTDAGLRTALVQRSDLSPEHLSSAFWASLVGGLAVLALFWAGAPALPRIFGIDELTSLTRAIAFTFPLSSLGVVPTALLSRRLAVGKIGSAEITGLLAGGAAGLWVASRGGGAWSLVAQILTQAAFESMALLLLARWRPRLSWDGKALRSLLPVSANFLGFSVFNYFVRNVDNFLVGRYAGASALGLYARAYSLMMLPLTHLSRVVGSVLFPALARLQDDPARSKQLYLRALQTIALVSFPATIGLFVTADEFVAVVFGQSWLGVVPLLRVLSVVSLTQSIGTTVGWIYQSQGRTDTMFRWALFTSIPTLVAFGIGIQWGAFGVAVAYAVRSILLVYPNHAIPGRLIGLRFIEVLRATRGILLCAAIMGVSVIAIGLLLPTMPNAALLGLRVSAGVSIYGLLLKVVRPQGLSAALGLLIRPASQSTTAAT